MTTKKHVKTSGKPSVVIYCGPTVQKVDLRKNSVFNAGIPKVYDDVIKECPAIKELFKPVADLTTTQLALNNSGSVESVMYQRVLAYLGGDK